MFPKHHKTLQNNRIRSFGPSSSFNLWRPSRRLGQYARVPELPWQRPHFFLSISWVYRLVRGQSDIWLSLFLQHRNMIAKTLLFVWLVIHCTVLSHTSTEVLYYPTLLVISIIKFPNFTRTPIIMKSDYTYTYTTYNCL